MTPSTNTDNTKDTSALFSEIKDGSHKQFILNTAIEKVECRCGHRAIWWRTGYLCGTITANPCSFNR